MSKDDDPFGFGDDEERTIIKPMPGGRPKAQPTASAPRPAAQEAGPDIRFGDRSGLNPLENAASTLFNMLGQIRNTSSHPNPGGLHQQLVQEIREFETRAQKAGASAESVFAARYALCTTIDEFVLGTPWGAGSIWAQQSLLSIFHKERSGGEKFFRLLQKLSQDPARNIDLLEFLYICLALGFQGRYAVVPNGLNELERVRESLYRTIRGQRGEPEQQLSPHWQGMKKAADAGKGGVPLWAVLAVIALVLSLVFVGMSYRLSALSDPVAAHLAAIGRDDALLPARVLAPPSPVVIEAPEPERVDLAGFLRPEIQQGLVEVQDLPDRTVVLIRGDGLFGSGNDRINGEYVPVLRRIGEAVEQVAGRVLVTGHSDNVPISTPRFPSNWALSTARAESVVRILESALSNPGRLVAEGQADTQPVASNDTPAGRAQNRRVEITVFQRGRSS